MRLRLSKGESAVLDNLTAKCAESDLASFASLLKSYRELVRNLDGYNFSIYDYDNDVSCRETIECVMELCEEGLRQKIEVVLQPLDDQFFCHTTEVKRLNGSKWSVRLPRNPGEALKEDIDSENM